MIIIKYIFLFCIFAGSSITGILLANKYKSRIQELKSFKEMMNILENKIKFTYEPLGNIFDDITKLYSNKNQVCKIFEQTKINMEKNDVCFSWEKAIDKSKQNMCLNKEDINIIKGLGKQLGKTDVEGQVSEIALTNEFLDIQIKDAEEQCKKNEKMYKTLGTIIGIAIVIILI